MNRYDYTHKKLPEEKGIPDEFSEKGVKVWRDKNGEIHRDHGPALIYPSGMEQYYKHGELHRFGGHAKEYPDGTGEFWVNGEQVDDGGHGAAWLQEISKELTRNGKL